MISPHDIIEFWFAPGMETRWFTKDAALDHEIKERFLLTYRQGRDGELDGWKSEARPALALILLLDQFPRNIFRDDPRAFATDAQALAVVRYGLQNGYDNEYTPSQCQFFYMPMMHSELLDDQEHSVDLYQRLGLEEAYDYAIQHRNVVAEYDRFPHRNAILGRPNSPAEERYLQSPDAGF
ncbi:MAG: hypothetical protein CMM94_03250 [Rickettsiales bacterium]|nr:hypothetical protein [Rickettsiales bacterium]|tara:strand:- start:268 stop:810 length:543 start_codon:yes stop_codon:yes gene_type:complete